MVIVQELREQLARIVFTAGFFLAIAARFAAVIAVLGGAVHAGWIILTEGRDGLLVRGGLSQSVMGVLPMSGYDIVVAWMAAFVLGAALCWIGARMSKNPGDPVDFSLKGLLGSYRALARLVTRQLLPRCWIDASRFARGRLALGKYRYGAHADGTLPLKPEHWRWWRRCDQ